MERLSKSRVALDDFGRSVCMCVCASSPHDAHCCVRLNGLGDPYQNFTPARRPAEHRVETSWWVFLGGGLGGRGSHFLGWCSRCKLAMGHSLVVACVVAVYRQTLCIKCSVNFPTLTRAGTSVGITRCRSRGPMHVQTLFSMPHTDLSLDAGLEHVDGVTGGQRDSNTCIVNSLLFSLVLCLSLSHFLFLSFSLSLSLSLPLSLSLSLSPHTQRQTNN